MLNTSMNQMSLSRAAAKVANLAEIVAVEAETTRKLDPGVVQAVLDAGFARHFVPARWGGDAGSFTDLTSAVAVIGERCASSAWFASLSASLSRMAAYLPVDGQAEVWSEGPDALIVGGLMPVGTAEAAVDGWRVTGEWKFVSAIDYSDWALLCAMVPTGTVPEARFFAVPRREFTIVDSWFTVGMRGTGSNTLVLDEVFVPASRSFSRDQLAKGEAVDGSAPCHATPLKAANGLCFSTPILGAARGALHAWITYVTERANVSSGGRLTPAVELTLARTGAEIDAAALLLERASAVADQGSVPALQVARNSRDCAVAVDLLVTAVDRVFRAAGTSGQSSFSTIQRFWRDVNVASGHIVLQLETAASAYAAEFLRQ